MAMVAYINKDMWLNAKSLHISAFAYTIIYFMKVFVNYLRAAQKSIKSVNFCLIRPFSALLRR